MTPEPPPIPIELMHPAGLDQPSPVYLSDLERGYCKTFQWLTHAKPEWIPVSKLEYDTVLIEHLARANFV